MGLQLNLPKADGSTENYHLAGTPIARPSSPPKFNRVAYAAAHVVADPLRDSDPWNAPAIDWEATMAFRRHLWNLGFKVAEAMDTAQRGGGLGWTAAKELIRRSIIESKTVGGADLACGTGTDHLLPADAKSVDDVIAAYETQMEFVEAQGGRPIMMASRALARVARSADDYHRVYSRILSQSQGKVVLHWLVDMFDPQLKGYWGADEFDATLRTVLGIIADSLLLVVVALLAWLSFEFWRAAWESGEKSPSLLATPFWIPYLFFVLGMVWLLIALLARLAAEFKQRETSRAQRAD